MQATLLRCSAHLSPSNKPAPVDQGNPVALFPPDALTGSGGVKLCGRPSTRRFGAAVLALSSNLPEGSEEGCGNFRRGPANTGLKSCQPDRLHDAALERV